MFFVILYQYIESLKWVLLISGFLYFYRKEIMGILNRPFSVSHNGTKVDFPLTQQQKEESSSEEKQIIQFSNQELDQVKENLNKKESEIKDKDQQIFKLTIEKHFEYTYRLIFRSQIQLLQNLQTVDGFSVIQLDAYFQNIKNTFPAEFIHWDSNLYLKFLYDQNLIFKDAVTGRVKITQIGDLFLKYLIINVYNFNTEKGL